MPMRAKKSTTEVIEELEGFRDGVLGLVQKYFGRKRGKPAPKKRGNGYDVVRAALTKEETISD